MRPAIAMRRPAGLRTTVLVAILLLAVDMLILSHSTVQAQSTAEKRRSIRELGRPKTFGSTLHDKQPTATDIVAAKRRAERKKLEQQTNRLQQVRAEREEFERQINALEAEIVGLQARCHEASKRAEEAARQAALYVAAGAGIGAALGGPLGAAVGGAIGGATAGHNEAEAAAAARECLKELAELAQQLEALRQQLAKLQEETEAILRELQKAQADLQNRRKRGEWQAKREERQVKRPSIPAVDKSKLGAIPRRSGDADKLIRPATGAAAKSGPASRSLVVERPCGTPDNPCRRRSTGPMAPGLLEGDRGFAVQGPSAVGSPIPVPSISKSPSQSFIKDYKVFAA